MEDLLEEIRQKSGMEYVSDLKYRENWSRLLPAVMEIPEEAYHPRQWQEAYDYIIREGQSNTKNKETLIAHLESSM